MVDIDCAVGDVPCLTADDDHGFEIDEAEVIYWGLCPSCRPAGTAKRGNESLANTTKPMTIKQFKEQP